MLGVRTASASPGWSAHRGLAAASAQRGLAVERLATGLRINRAADDAAGLAISEGLRSVVGGSRVALRNTGQGIDLVRTAEAALGTTTDLLQRMRDLAVQRGNADVLGATALAAIDTELGALREELGRTVASTTGAAGRLLGGSALTLQVGAAAGDTVVLQLSDLSALRTFAAGGVVTVPSAAPVPPVPSGAPTPAPEAGPAPAPAPAAEPAPAGTPATNPALQGQETAATTTDGSTVRIAGLDLSRAESFDRLNGTITYQGASLDLYSVDFAPGSDAATRLQTLQQALDTTLGAGAVTVSDDGGDAVFTGAGRVVQGNAGGNGGGGGGGGLGGVIGGVIGGLGGGNGPGTSAEEVQVSFTAASGPTAVKNPPPDPVDPDPVDPDPVDPDPVDPGTTDPPVSPHVDGLVAQIDAVLGAVLEARSYLGASENRLEHTSRHLGSTIENAMAAESRIRDADVAQETTRLVRASLQADVAAAMLAQAVRTPEQVLALLR